jgi:hypothetical protein
MPQHLPMLAHVSQAVKAAGAPAKVDNANARISLSDTMPADQAVYPREDRTPTAEMLKTP